ncbi:phosphate signaling complex protein PhoU [Alkalibacter mobilis]|uniref:phosphate signaling complex protein PhoU n=1 Tax=Alkalibacter mobilis TaxID=2787712 RepID=UPI00189FF1D0|nr:phosphate signaling complex protein PhoU [Alkalibacter mobilis]MBF7097083.1 phosphate signaling complex protein PhoU [Alkalibacter mobilis]
MRDKMLTQIQQINEKIINMSHLVEVSIENAISAFADQNVDKARKIIEEDIKINDLEQEIEDLCVSFAATQSPVASDLRRLLAILKVVTDLERIGDYSCNIAEVVIEINKSSYMEIIPGIIQMEEEVKTMLNDSIKAYFTQDVKLAAKTAERDETVDELYEKIYRQLLFTISQNEKNEDRVIGHILVGRYLERIADHATNICERLIYMETGERVKF